MSKLALYFDSPPNTTFVLCHSFSVANTTSLNYYNDLNKDITLKSWVFNDPLRTLKCSSFIAIISLKVIAYKTWNSLIGSDIVQSLKFQTM
jgi:hypothetical protein